MIYQTELMRSILTSPTAQKIIDYVSQIYGESYVGLWLFQVIGMALDGVCENAVQLRRETSPATSELLLDFYEQEYGLSKDQTLTTVQRQKRLIGKIQSRGPCNPVRLASAVSGAIGGIQVDITENIAKNTFLVNIREVVEDLTPAITVLERMKPAHLIYEIRVVTQTMADTEIKTAVAVTRLEKYKVEVLQ